MTRTFWTPLVLILTLAVLALPAAAQSQTREQERQKAECERAATNCLGRCASIDTNKEGGGPNTMLAFLHATASEAVASRSTFGGEVLRLQGHAWPSKTRA
jgi:CHASE1-domain containing sensor protein